MQILGIRTAPTTVRYAVVESDIHGIQFLNSDGENRLDFPADQLSTAQKLSWFYQEIERIFRQYPNIQRVVLKSNEYVREKKSTRQSTYLEAAALLFAGQRAIAVETVLYSNLGTNSKEVKSFAETSVGRSEKYWNTQMADAVAAAFSGRHI